MYHFSANTVSRKKGKSVVGAASYISGEKLYDRYYGKPCDNSRRQDVLYTEILLPPDAPLQFYDRDTFWNAVDEAEKRCDSRTARIVIMALPNELTHDEHITLTRTFVLRNFVSLGMGADIAIHSGHRSRHGSSLDMGIDITPDNPHAHILVTTRSISREGFSKKKERDWNKKHYLHLWRREWAKAQNQEFERKGLDIRVSHESYAAQGIKKEPTKHLGRAVKELERRGIQTDRSIENQAIKTRNKERDTKKREKNYKREHVRSR